MGGRQGGSEWEGDREGTALCMCVCRYEAQLFSVYMSALRNMAGFRAGAHYSPTVMTRSYIACVNAPRRWFLSEVYFVS